MALNAVIHPLTDWRPANNAGLRKVGRDQLRSQPTELVMPTNKERNSNQDNNRNSNSTNQQNEKKHASSGSDRSDNRSGMSGGDNRDTGVAVEEPVSVDVLNHRSIAPGHNEWVRTCIGRR